MNTGYTLTTLAIGALVALGATAQTPSFNKLTVQEAHEAKRVQAAPAWVNASAGLRGGGANDECDAAISITSGTECTPTSGSLDGATESLPAAACSGFTASVANDVWFSFVATGESTIIRVTGGGDATTGVDPVLEAFSGACADPISLGCIDVTLRGATESLTIATTVGTTYYYRVYYWPYTAAQTVFDFTTCVFEEVIVAPPANDDCAGAIMLTPNAWCINTGANVDGSTESLPGILCNGFTGNANDDVWYSFVATATEMTVGAQGWDDGDNDPNTGYDAVVEVFDGCGGASLACADATLGNEIEQVDLAGLMIGNTYYFRVYNWYTAMATPNGVDVCVVPGAVSIGIEENDLDRAWTIYPNPSAGQINLSYSGANGSGTIEVMDATGRLVHSQQMALATGSVGILRTGQLNAGNYTVRMTVNGERSQQRLTVQ